MRVTEVKVADLFGMFNHTIALHHDARITIIHGPNGFGKTVILKMLDGLFNARYATLRAVPFREMAVSLDDGTTLTVRRQKGEGNRRKNVRLTLNATARRKELGTVQLDEADFPPGFPASMIDDLIPKLNRIGPEQWLDMSSGQHLTLRDILEEYADDFPKHLPHYLRDKHAAPPWLRQLQESMNVHFIDTNRLRTGRPHDARRASRRHAFPELAVLRYAEDLADRIRSKLAESAALSQSLDRTFPARLMQRNAANELADDVIRQRLAQLEDKRSRLKAAGLLDKADDMGFQVAGQTLDAHTKQVLSVYAQDVETKLAIFDDIAGKLELFETLLNNHFLYKKMSINKDTGFSFTGFDGTPLGPADLSSGEQHELVLLYELLFKVAPESLILVDEPEISLHVAWQDQFLPDLEKIIGLSRFDVLIATHSPQVIGDRWDLTVELKGPDIRPKEPRAVAMSA